MAKLLLRLCYALFILMLLETTARIGSKIITLRQGGDFVINEFQQGIIRKIISGDSNYIVHDGNLGWTIRSSGQGQMYAANSFGIRSSRDYTYSNIPTGLHRIVAFGDSYTHSDNVPNQQAWPAQIEQLEPKYEVLNFGVPGYGLDQAYLRFLEYAGKFKANIVIIGMMSENVYRHINTFRPFYHARSDLPMSKPRFVLDENGLRKIPNYFSSPSQYSELLNMPEHVIPLMGRYDYYYNHRLPNANCTWSMLPCFSKQLYWLVRTKIDREQKNLANALLEYHLNAEGPQVTLAIVKAFAEAVKQRGMQPVFVIFPYKIDYTQYRIVRKTTYQNLLAEVEKLGIPSWDGLEAFKEGSSINLSFDDLFDGHYTAKANHLIAEWIIRKTHQLEHETASSVADTKR